MIEEHTRDGVTVLRLCHGKASVMDLELCEAIAERFEAMAEAGGDPVVLTGTGNIFCAGVDLLRVCEGGADYLADFLPALGRAFEAVFVYPGPVVAAVNGHAVAGGCVLVCAADRRLMELDAGRIGVPELAVGVPFPVIAVEIMRGATGRDLEQVLYGATTYGSADALRLGLVDEVSPGPVLDRAVEVAAALAALPAEGYRLTKALVRAPALERVAASGAAEAGVRAAWAEPATLVHLQAYVARTLGKRA
jgi:enoyl-CoA hydratase